jgi:hypothetical protein
MAEYDNNMRGVAFYNDYKKTDNQPSYRGTLEIDGVEYKQSIWVKVAKNGKKFLSFSYEKADEQKASTKKSQPQIDTEIDDEIPF